eukprot:PhF_6_TR14245/c1_g1_i1/m.22860
MSREEVCKIEEKACLRFGLRWIASSPIDVDAACSAYDGFGHIVDVAYYNNLHAINSIIHSGDCVAGKEEKQDDETISIHFDTVPSHIVALIISVHCHKSGSFANCDSVTARLMDLKTQNLIDKHTADYTKGDTSLLLYQIQRNNAGPGWVVYRWHKALPGRNFMDALPQILPIVGVDPRKAPPLPKLKMQKGDDFEIPGNLTSVKVGLGWDTKCDLDASAIMLDEYCNSVDLVYYQSKRSVCGGVIHSGDNLTGEGAGDDEVISVELDRVSKKVFAIIFTVNVFTSGKSFEHVKGEYCRLVDAKTNQELFRFDTLDSGNSNGVLFCVVYRDVTKEGWWKAEALGVWGWGHVARDLLPLAQNVACRLPGSRGSQSQFTPQRPYEQPPRQGNQQQQLQQGTGGFLSTLTPKHIVGILILLVIVAMYFSGSSSTRYQGRRKGGHR